MVTRLMSRISAKNEEKEDTLICDQLVAKSLNLELHSVKERISSAKAGLMTWKDYLSRILELSKEFQALIESALEDITRAEVELEEMDKDENVAKTTIQQQMELIKVIVIQQHKKCLSKI